MRAAILNSSRAVLIAFIAFGLLNLAEPVMAASARPLGTVLAASHARLDNADAENGADIYSDDALVTDEGGSLQFRVGASQLYLLSLSSATLEPRANRIQANIGRGTLGFSTAEPEKLEIQTPVGVIRGANGQPIYGQVSVLSSGKMQITSYRGTLLVDINGQERTVPQGEAYEATLVSDSAGGAAGVPISVGGNGFQWTRIAFVAAIAAFLALLARFVIWPSVDESCMNMNCMPSTQ